MKYLERVAQCVKGFDPYDPKEVLDYLNSKASEYYQSQMLNHQRARLLGVLGSRV